jgi:hypothetical protein
MVKHTQNPRPSNSSDNPHRPTKGKGGLRSKSTIMRLNMYKRGNPVRNKDGKIIGGTLMMADKAGGKDLPNVARIAPDRRWFGNTRTISQNDLDKFREEMTLKEAEGRAWTVRSNQRSSNALYCKPLARTGRARCVLGRRRLGLCWTPVDTRDRAGPAPLGSHGGGATRRLGVTGPYPKGS